MLQCSYFISFARGQAERKGCGGMSDWDAELYLKFEMQRTQPAIDLANRIKGCSLKKVADIGCGPGNSTAILKSLFPDADIEGIDNSQNMVEKAQNSYKGIRFRLCDIHGLESGYDLLFSNACLQWVPNHESLLPELMQKLNPGGLLAVQIPMNGNEPLYQIITDVASAPKWNLNHTCFETNKVLSPNKYMDILSICASDFQIWETAYYHRIPSHRALVDWVRGTRLRPYLAELDEKKALEFEGEILNRAVAAYPVMRNGEVVLRFNRLFFIASKSK